jgi:septal ring factor EnvC (AmiA/AmiB activator)
VSYVDYRQYQREEHLKELEIEQEDIWHEIHVLNSSLHRLYSRLDDIDSEKEDLQREGTDPRA